MKGKVWNIAALPALEAAAAEILGKLPERAEGAAVLALSGELGAGKTTFTQALGRQLGVGEPVLSPTFVIMKRYQTTNPRWRSLIHIDAYRLESPAELEILGWQKWQREADSLIVVEWAERVYPLLPPDSLRLSFELAGAARTIRES